MKAKNKRTGEIIEYTTGYWMVDKSETAYFFTDEDGAECATGEACFLSVFELLPGE